MTTNNKILKSRVIKCEGGTPRGGLVPKLTSGTWGDRGKGNELQSALEKGLSWIGDKFVNGADYLEDGFNYLVTAPLAAVTGKTKEIPRVIDLMRELRHNMSLHYAMNPVFDLVSPIKGGWMLKGLMKGSQLEKLLSKAGTININGLQAYLNKASKLELDVIGRVLSTKFAGLKNIDYNALKKAVSDELITYSRVPQVDYEDYGIEGLGFKRKPFPERSPGLMFGVEDFMHDSELNKAFPYPVKFNTFTFESPRIPRGNDKHYDIATLGHSRTFTVPDEPDILYVMESQSDWGLSTKDLTPRFVYKRDVNGNTNIIFDESGKFHYTENGKGMPYNEFMDLSKPNDLFPFYIAKTLFQENYPIAQVNHLHTNYLQRQLQENMKYAAEQGLKRMRYPTSDTAAKIEGYSKVNLYKNPLGQIVTGKEALEHTNPDVIDDLRLDLADLAYSLRQLGILPSTNSLWVEMNNQLKTLESPKVKTDYISLGLDYTPEHQTILKKYSDFPKMFNKLFKGLEVRTVTDPKGNTWYEVDIPENFLQAEWQFKKGGSLKSKPTLISKVKKHLGGGRLDIESLRNDPEFKKNFNLHMNANNLSIANDSLINRGANNALIGAVLTLIISESGGETKPHGNGAYGLIGWRGERAKGLPTSLSGLLHHLMKGLFESHKDWSDGGPGMNIGTGKEMLQFFKDGAYNNYRKATNAVMNGYVRPPEDLKAKRHALVLLVKKYMK